MLNEQKKKTYFIGVGSIIRACMCVATGDFTCAIRATAKSSNKLVTKNFRIIVLI